MIVWSGRTYHVSKLLNFLVTTFPRSIPSRSTMRCAKSGWDVPEKTFMFGILDCILRTLDFSKLSRTKLLARIGLADRTGITQSTKIDGNEKITFFLFPIGGQCAWDGKSVDKILRPMVQARPAQVFLCACVGTAPDNNLTKRFLNVCEWRVATCTTETTCQRCQKFLYIVLWVAKLLNEPIIFFKLLTI